MIKTLKEFWTEVATISYDTSDYGVIAQIRSQYRTNEINNFVNAFVPGTEILKDGKNGAPVVMGASHRGFRGRRIPDDGSCLLPSSSAGSL